METEVLSDGSIKVCYEEDGLRACSFVSSMHLAGDKEKQLKEMVRGMGEAAFRQ